MCYIMYVIYNQVTETKYKDLEFFLFTTICRLIITTKKDFKLKWMMAGVNVRCYLWGIVTYISNRNSFVKVQQLTWHLLNSYRTVS